MHRQSGAGSDALTLGVKGRLSNQEMEMLRTKLKAQHAAKPMTKVYRRVGESEDRGEANSCSSFRPGRKTLASIQYEASFTEPASDALRVQPPATKGISAAAKTRLQDEYVTKPRRVSSVPVSLSRVADDDDPSKQAKGGKRAAPAQIPQVFIL
ncbi:hypothetical protein PybrP1_004432 [[Pythium] brassicae (nom. inval.)]|nr:hypothetical protein PybrP1_004432 [[Pythium] brassicae (nom. inval.)]